MILLSLLFKMVDPNQRQVDDAWDKPDRATFVGRNVVLSRPPKTEEVGATIVLDVVEYLTPLACNDDSAIAPCYLTNSHAVLGVAKNN